ncbi:MAG: hypothetical protein GC153_00070 [Alphaproteobacteria bacterium]|nr:hypothetical protein [Alphaproteobacteria bacterium]
METPPNIAFEGVTPTDALRTRIENEVARLERFFGRLTACKVVVSKPQGRHRHGDLFAVSVRLTLPGGREVYATRNPSANHAHKDAGVAIRDVFRAARRQLQDRARMMEGAVKQHEGRFEAVIGKIVAEENYGFLESAVGDEIYFHRNSVAHDGFDKLKVGERVAYVETSGDKGPQASYVKPI